MKQKWHQDGYRESEHRLVVINHRNENMRLNLAVWKEGGAWKCGTGGAMFWGKFKTRAEAQRAAVATCLRLCNQAVKALREMRK